MNKPEQQYAQHEQKVPEISSQIVVSKTDKKLIAFNDKLNPAAPKEYACIHGSGDNDTGSRVYSLIGLVLLDYSNGTGENTISLTANLSPEDVSYLFDLLKQGKESVDFRQDKIFGNVDGIVYGGIVTKVCFMRNSFGSDGEKRKYPWYIEVQNGTGIKVKGKNGGTFIQANSYKMVKKAYINLNDLEMYRLFYKVRSYVEMWEMTFGTQLLRQAIKIKQTQHQAY